MEGYTLRWYSEDRQIAEIFVHADSGFLMIKKPGKSYEEDIPVERLFIPKEQLKLIKKAASKGR
ncbi:MAG TPA: hypothetical protein VE439_02755 [Anaerolineae bacterium]|jgi:hypothetical protein|nr:hypothetical protein [Anaerolineae bacterium]